MTKVDKKNYFKKEELPSEYNDAHAGLRGYANSDLASSVIFSAGMNPRLYGYIAQFNDFFPDESGYIKKKIILKVSDYRSAVIQGKFLAKKGISSEPSIVTFENTKKSLKIWQDDKFDDSDWNKMHQALLGVIESDFGTARSIRDLKQFQVAGKSGTAELVSLDSKEAYQEVRTSELLRDHSIIIAFGPMPNPRYAVSVVIENGESGGAVAGPVAIEVLKSLINE